MKLNKWNFEKHVYEPFDSPAKDPVTFESDLNARRDCANCGKNMPFGLMFTSRTIHTNVGFGYGVCDSCYKKEFEDENRHK